MRHMPHVSVRTAAELTGKDRSTITRAIDAGKLSATRDEHGRFLIDPAELERVFGSLSMPSDARTDAVHEHARPLHENALARELELVREILERDRATHERERQEWHEERSFLRSMLERQTDQVKLLTDERQRALTPRSPSLFSRLFRKNT
jgi:excisionase family DNA binding protein